MVSQHKSSYFAYVASAEALVPFAHEPATRTVLGAIMEALVDHPYIREVADPRENQFTMAVNGVSMPLSGKALQDALAEEAEAIGALEYLNVALERKNNEAVRAAKAVVI